jgi:hypothetical protein
MVIATTFTKSTNVANLRLANQGSSIPFGGAYSVVGHLGYLAQSSF